MNITQLLYFINIVSYDFNISLLQISFTSLNLLLVNQSIILKSKKM